MKVKIIAPLVSVAAGVGFGQVQAKVECMAVFHVGGSEETRWWSTPESSNRLTGKMKF